MAAAQIQVFNEVTAKWQIRFERESVLGQFLLLWF